MEISRHQFAQKLPLVERAIKECDFMAIDTELSGTVTKLNTKSIETRY